jgi:hypothetical protein
MTTNTATALTLPPVYLHRDKVFVLPANPDGAADTTPVLLEQLGTALVNLAELGYTFSPALIQRLSALPQAQFLAVYARLLPELKKRKGAHKTYRPMYPNFPRQVMEAHPAELWLNAILHYWFGLLPDYVEEKRPAMPLPPFETMTVLEAGTGHEFRQIPKDLLAAKSSLSVTEKEQLGWFFQNFGDDAAMFLPPEIPFKENLALAVTLLLKYTRLDPGLLRPHVKNATDVLRIAAVLSGGDASLAKPPKFRSFKRKERRLLLALLEAQPNRMEDTLRHAEIWKRLAHGLHVGEFKSTYPAAYACLSLLRAGTAYPTTNHVIEMGLARGDLDSVLARLKHRPGDLARRLDHLLRLHLPEPPAKPSGSKFDTLLRLVETADSRQAAQARFEVAAHQVLDLFETVAHQVSTPVLLQVLTHFKDRNRTAPAELRTFFPKGNLAKVKSIDNKLPDLPPTVTETVVAICRAALIDRFKALPPLGPVYVDEALRGYVAPLTARSSSKALRTLTRGSRVPFPADFGTTLRFFLWWKEGQVPGTDEETGRVDLDLSALVFDTDWALKDSISYHHLRNQALGAYHSGDITSAPDGACEFIDLDIAKVLKNGGRYVVMSVNGYTTQPFVQLPECFAGWMMREDPQSGQIFEPSTVRDKVDLAADSTMALPVILDLEQREVIWTDLALKRNLNAVNNVRTNEKSINVVARAMTQLVRPDLYELFTLHVAARGRRVYQRNQAETVFAADSGTVTPFDQEIIRANYL